MNTGRAHQPEWTASPLACHIVGSGPDLVLLHGGFGSWTHWLRNLPALSERYRVLAFDLPGFGDSPDFPEALPDEAYFRWVADAILAGAKGDIRLAGFSFGGSVAAAVAPLLGERLIALSLTAPGSFGKPPPRNVSVKPIRPRDGHEVDPRDNARHNLGQIMFARLETADSDTVCLHLENLERGRFPSRRLSWQDRIEADIASVSCPIQMIWGLADRMATPSVPARVDRIRGWRPDIRFDLIGGAGHWVQYECAPEFDATLLAFLDTIRGPPG
jgi:2-hydroxy-6-oxonona-2,4-dienedioate hydrolase